MTSSQITVALFKHVQSFKNTFEIKMVLLVKILLR